MNAKEMAENARRESMTYSEDSTCGYIFTPEEFCQFCEQLCREQREICADNYGTDDSPDSYMTILNSKQPEL